MHFTTFFTVPDTNLTSSSDIPRVKHEIELYMAIEAGMALALLLAYFAYFPKEPPSPPSASASLQRTNFKDGLKALVKDKNVLLCTFAYSLSGGINGAWAVRNNHSHMLTTV